MGNWSACGPIGRAPDQLSRLRDNSTRHFWKWNYLIESYPFSV